MQKKVTLNSTGGLGFNSNQVLARLPMGPSGPICCWDIAERQPFLSFLGSDAVPLDQGAKGL